MVVFVVLAWLLVGASVGAAADVVVVCPARLQPAITAWKTYRESQGRALVVVPPAATAQQTLASLKQSCKVPPRWIVLLGDAADEKQPIDTQQATPTWFVPAVVNPRWGSEPTLATDLPYGDWDGDGSAEIALGRVPADSAEELHGYFARVMAEEGRRETELGEYRLNIVASPGRFSPLLDRVVESTATQLLTGLAPPACDLHLTYADWKSPFCPYPVTMPQAIAEGLQQRSVAWVYLGHAHRQTLDMLQTPLGHSRLLNNELASALKGPQSAPVAAIVACYAGAFDGSPGTGSGDCLAEAMLRQSGGPLAVLAGSRVTMPYGNSLLGLETLDGLFHGNEATLGQLIASAKRRALQPAEAAANEPAPATLGLRDTVETVAAGFTPAEADRRQERLEHVQMYNLLGDPLLQLRRAQPLVLQARLRDASTVVVTGQSPIAGRCRLQIKPTASATAPVHSARTTFSLGPASRLDYQRQYREANQRFVVEQLVDIPAGAFAAELAVDEALQAKLSVSPASWRVVVQVAGQAGLAAGHSEIESK